MPSTDLTKAPGLLDLESDQRDWFSEFRDELAKLPQPQPETLFTVVKYGRPAPIVVPAAAEADPTPVRQRRSLLGRVKRSLSPAVAALFLVYVVVIFMTGWIGIRRSEATRKADLTIQASTPQPSEIGFGLPANDVP